MKKIIKFAAVSIAVLMLVGCAAWKGSGVVTQKLWYEGYYSTQSICASYGTNGICTVYVPINSWNPPTYHIKVRDSDSKTHDVTLKKADWDPVQTGQQITID